MPTRSINVGMIVDAGYVAENAAVARYLTAQGFRPVKVEELLTVLDYAISTPVNNVDDAQLLVGLTDPGQQQQGMQAAHLADAKFHHVRSAAATAAAAAMAKTSVGPPTSSLQSQLQDAAGSEAAMHAVVRDAIVAQVAKVLVVAAEDIHPAQSIAHYGGDSLSAVEMRSWMARALEAQVGVMEILSGQSIELLAAEVAGRSVLVQRVVRSERDRIEWEGGVVAGV